MRTTLLSSAAVAALALGGCSSGGTAGEFRIECGDGSPFCLVSCNLGCTPSGCSLTQISQNQSLTFEFSRELDPSTVSDSSISIRNASGQTPDGQLLVEGNTVRFVPNIRFQNGQSSFGFARGESYTLTIRGGDAAGQAVASVSGRRLADSITCPTPHCYYNDSDQFLLILEDLTPLSRNNPGVGASAKQSTDAIASLAKLHATEQPTDLTLPGFSHGFTAAAPDMQGFGIAALDRFATSQAVQFMRHYAANSLTYLPLFNAQPMVLSHMDYRSDNLAYTDRGVVVFDWGEFSLAPPGFDLACYLVTSIDAMDRRTREAELMDIYLTVSADHDVLINAEALKASYLLSIPPAFYLAALMLERGEEDRGRQFGQRCLAAIEDHLPELQRLYTIKP